MRIRLLCCAYTLLLFSGCYSLSIERPVASLPPQEVRQHFFVLGLVGEPTIDLAKQCPKGVARFGDTFKPTDVLLAIVSLGLYTPKTVTFACAA